MAQIGLRRRIVKARRPHGGVAEQRHIGREAWRAQRDPTNGGSKLAFKRSLRALLSRKPKHAFDLQHMRFLRARERNGAIAFAREFVTRCANRVEFRFVEMARKHRRHIFNSQQAVGPENERQIAIDHRMLFRNFRSKQAQTIPYARRVVTPVAIGAGAENLTEVERTPFADA